MGMDAYYSENDPHAAAWLSELVRAGLIPAGTVDARDIKEVRGGDIQGRHAHFFAGVAGWAEALRIAGWPAGREVWTGSCPCQPFSSAGKRRGAADERHLWPEFFRLVAERRPQCVLGEQVESAVRHGWLDGVFADLEGAGYACGAVVLGAHSAGAPHIRQRLYWAAHRPLDGLADAKGPGRDERAEPARDAGQETGEGGRLLRTGGHGSDRRVADPDGRLARDRGLQPGGQHGQQPADGGIGGLGDAQRAGLEVGDSARGVGPRRPGPAPEPPRLGGSGFWSDFAAIPCTDGRWRRVPPRGAQPGLQPLVDGFPSVVDGVRNRWLDVHPLTAAKVEGRAALLKGAGNAIVPQTAALFVRAFMEAVGVVPAA